MKWRRPTFGNSRVTSFFAIVPVSTMDEVRWLEHVTVVQIKGNYGWENILFIDY